MKPARISLLLLVAGTFTLGCNPWSSSSSSEMSAEDMAAFEAAREKQLAIEREQAKHASYAELPSIKPGKDGRFQSLSALALTRDLNLLACDAGTSKVYTIDPKGATIATWKLNFQPQAIAVASDGAVFVAGQSVVAKLDGEGKILKQAKLRGQGVSSATASDKDVFVCLRRDTGFTVQRFNLDLEDSKEVIKGLRGCCGILDIVWQDGKLHAAENGRFRIVSYDRDGKEIGKWGDSDREDVSKFAGCCNPKNLCLAADGRVYTAESSPDRIKRYSADGKYEELIGWFTGREGCWGVDLVATPDGKRIYYADSTANFIRALEPKPAGAGVTASTNKEVKP